MLGPICIYVHLAAWREQFCAYHDVLSKKRDQRPLNTPHVLPPQSQLLQAIRFRKSQQPCDRCSSAAPRRASRPRC